MMMLAGPGEGGADPDLDPDLDLELYDEAAASGGGHGGAGDGGLREEQLARHDFEGEAAEWLWRVYGLMAAVAAAAA
mgnify:CR=1 FL=1